MLARNILIAAGLAGTGAYAQSANTTGTALTTTTSSFIPSPFTIASDSVDIGRRNDACHSDVFGTLGIPECATSPTPPAVTVPGPTVTEQGPTVTQHVTEQAPTVVQTVTKPGPTQNVIMSQSTSLSPYTSATATETRPVTTETIGVQDSTGGFKPISTVTSFTKETKYTTGTKTLVTDIPVATRQATGKAGKLAVPVRYLAFITGSSIAVLSPELRSYAVRGASSLATGVNRFLRRASRLR